MVGYGRDSIADAVCAQMKKMPYFAGVFGTVPAIKFCPETSGKTSENGQGLFFQFRLRGKRKAYKIVRQASRISPKRKGKYKIMYRDRDYHGTTIGAMSSTGQAQRKQDFGPFVEGFVEIPHACCYRCPFDKTYGNCNIECARKVEDIIPKEGADSIGALIVEPITAGGGILKPVKEYYPLLQEICRKYDIWLIMDEVVCGFGRTGKFWGHDHFDVDPDIVTMAKGLASSYEALSATVVKQEIYDLFLNDPADPATRLNYFRDISTYGGCTSSMVAALRVPESSKMRTWWRTAGLSATICKKNYKSSESINASVMFVGSTLPGLNLSLTKKIKSQFLRCRWQLSWETVMDMWSLSVEPTPAFTV